MKRIIVVFALGFFASFTGLIGVYQSTEQVDRTNHQQTEKQPPTHRFIRTTGGSEFDCSANLVVSEQVCPNQMGEAEVTNLPEDCQAKDFQVSWSSGDGVKLMKNDEKVDEGKKLNLEDYKKLNLAAKEDTGTKQDVGIEATLKAERDQCKGCGTASDTTDVGCRFDITGNPSEINLGETGSFTVKYDSCGATSPSETCQIDLSSDDGINVDPEKLTISGGEAQKEVQITATDSGTFTINVNATDQCSDCGSESFNIEVKDEGDCDVNLVKFTPVGFPKCQRCGVGRSDFIIRTDPTGYAEDVKVEIPSQEAGTHTATASLCNSLEAEYTLKGPENGWFNFEGYPLGSAGEDVDRTNTKVWRTEIFRNRLITKKTWRLGDIRYSGSWFWEKLGRAKRPPGGTFSTSKSFSTSESVTVGGTVSYSFSGFSGELSLNLGVTFESTTSHELTSGPNQCDCGRSCNFRYTHYQSIIELTKDKMVLEKTQSTAVRGPNRDPDKLDKPKPDEFSENEDVKVADDTSTLPAMGQSFYNSTTDKKCVN